MDNFSRRQNSRGSRRQLKSSNLSQTPSSTLATTIIDVNASLDQSAKRTGNGDQSSRRTGIGSSRRANHSKANLNSDRKPAVTSSEADDMFRLKAVEMTAKEVLAEVLHDVQYDPVACRDMSPEVASAILERIRQFSLPQYKLVCIVTLGSLMQKPGVQFGSRCLWNKDTDNFLSVKYSNGSVYAVALIFGLFVD